MAKNFRDTLSPGIENKIRARFVDKIYEKARKAVEESIKEGQLVAIDVAQVDTGFQREHITTSVGTADNGNIIFGEIGMYAEDFLGQIRRGSEGDSQQVIDEFYPIKILAGEMAITAGINVAEQELDSRIGGLK